MEDIVTFQGNIDALAGRDVYGNDGHKIGTVGQVFVMQGTTEPTWVTVQTGFFGSHESFVPMSGATERGGELLVPYDKAFVKDAPRIDEASELTVEQEGELYRYYGVQPPMQQRDASGHEGAARDTHDGHRDGADRRDSDHGDSDRHDADHHDSGHRDSDRDGSDRDGAGIAGVGQHSNGQQGGPRLKRRIVTEMQTIQVPVQREEIYVEGDDQSPQSGDGEHRSS